MNQFEEFENIYWQQINEEENHIYSEESEDEENYEEEENNIIINEGKNEIIKSKIKESTSKRLRVIPKRYQTFTIDYKKKVIEEVIIIIIIIYLIKQVKINKNEKEVADIYGIKLKTVHRWVTKGFKKNQGKLKYLYIIGGGRKIREPEMVDKLLKWYYTRSIIEGQKITTKDFKKKALEFSKDMTFRASKGWLQKFRKRYNIKLN